MTLKNIAYIDTTNKTVVDKVWYHDEKFKPEFKEYTTKEDMKIVRANALFFYRKVLNTGNLFPIDSAVTGMNYYTIYYNTMHTVLPNGKHVNDHENVFEYEIEYNPNYYDLFLKELNKLAMKDEVYIHISMSDDFEWGDKVISGTSLTKEEFESKYQIPLDEYYKAITMNYNKQGSKKERLFRQELSELKANYFKFLIEDADRGFDRYDIESDGYGSYSILEYKFQDIKNKEEILDEFGFELDRDNYLLSLKPFDKELKLKR